MSFGATKYEETIRDKNNCVHVHLGQILDSKIQKTWKVQLPLLKNWEQKQDVGNKSRALWTAPARSTTKGVGRPHIHASSQDAGPATTLTPWGEPAWPSPSPPTSSESKLVRMHIHKILECTYITCPAIAESPIEFCLNYLSGLLLISVD